ncbi:MAG: LTA synthase family protein [Lachnospiraceae bacterium]|nr:LTA synthase family protein [Lachnospiraceae bacterium]MDE6698996.1 LTA synthase family protein [Lachnospiraceae bacterium]
MEKFKAVLKKIFVDKIYLSNRLYYFILFAIPITGVVVKNVLLQAYLLGDNLYSPNFSEAIKSTWKYWIIYIALVLIPLSVAFLFRREKHRVIYIYGWNFFFTLLICLDLIYSRSFFTMPSAADVYIFKNFSGFEGGEVTSLLCGYDFIIFIDIILLSGYIWKFRRRQTDEVLRKRVMRISAAIFLIAGIAVILAIPLQSKIFGLFNDTYDKMFNSTDASEQSKYLSSLGFHIKDISELVEENINTDLTEEEKDIIESYYEWKNENIPDNEYAGIFEGKNVLFLQIESLESFIINQTVDGQEICPNINKLLNNGFYFSNIFEQVQGGNSSDADLMYTTSRLPVLKGGTFFRFADECELNSLPRMLINRGYDFTYHQAIKGSFWNYEEGWRNMIGADGFVGSESYDMSGDKIGFTLNDEDYIKQVIPYLEDLNTPFYAHVVLNSSHMPFKLDDSLKELELSEELDDSYLGGYFQCVKYVDTRIGMMLEELEQAGVLDNTVIVVIGDHTGIHKYYEYSLEKWYDEYPFANVNGYYTVPLIISCSDFKENVSSDVIAGQIDVMPTLSYLMGIKDDEYMNDAMGRILLKTKRSYAIYRDGTIYGDLTEEEKKLVSQSYEISEKLFNSGK